MDKYVGEESYVADFAYFPAKKKCILIEISPFLTCTGPALFNWRQDREVFFGTFEVHFQILENGPFEFRLNEKERPNFDELIESNWETRWNTVVQPYWNYFPPPEPFFQLKKIFRKIVLPVSASLIPYLLFSRKIEGGM